MMGHLQHGPAALRRHPHRRYHGHPPAAAATALILLLAAVSLCSAALAATAVGSPLTIPLARRRREVKRRREGNGDKSQTATLTRFEAGVFAFFATLEVPSAASGNEGEVQAIDVLVDTGSSHLLLPSSLCNSEFCETDWGPVLQKLDLQMAGAEVILCDDPRCKGSCTKQMLQDRGLFGVGDGEHTANAFCGMYGGICQSSFSPSPSSPSACLVFDSYADGSWALGPLVSTPTARLANLTVPNPLFAAVAEASYDFFEVPQGGGILGLAMGVDMGQRAPNECATPCVTPLLDRLWAAAGQSEQPLANTFSIVGQGEGSALLILGAGGGEPTTAEYHAGPLRYSPLQRPWAWYTVGVVGLEISTPGGGNDSVVIAQYSEADPIEGSGAVLDTGTTGLVFPPEAFAFFRQTMQAHFCHIPYVCSPSRSSATAMTKEKKERLRGGRGERHLGNEDGQQTDDGGRVLKSTKPTTVFDGDDTWVPWDPEVIAQLPTLTFLLHPETPGEPPVRLGMGPEQYMSKASDDDVTRKGEMRFYYALDISEGNEYVLGETLLHKHFVEFDRERKRAGFAPAAAAF